MDKGGWEGWFVQKSGLFMDKGAGPNLITPPALKSLPRSHSESQISSRQYTISGCIAISNEKYTFAFKEVKHV